MLVASIDLLEFLETLTCLLRTSKMDTYNKGLEAINDKPRDCLLNGFPVGLRVLVIDDDRTCLTILERMLKRCLYQGTLVFLCLISLLFLLIIY